MPNLLTRFLNQQTVRLKADHWLFSGHIAHRGFHNQDIPENSLAAFQNAIDQKYAIELDIHILKDGEIIVFHDNDLSRMVGIKKSLKDLCLHDFNELKLGGTNEKVPTLKEVLSLVDGQVPIFIEIKNSSKVGLLEHETFNILKSYKGPFAIQSFNPLSLAWFRLKLPNVPRGMLSTLELNHLHLFKRLIIKNYFMYPLVAPSYIAQDINSWDLNVVKYLRKNCEIPLIIWTVRSKEKYINIKTHCENIIFEDFSP